MDNSDSDKTDLGVENGLPEATENTESIPDKRAPVEPSSAPFLPPPAAIREEFVQNAVNFLKHPNVKGSPVKYRRSFLEKKGLTSLEIDEAFRRVPDEAPSSSSALPTPPVLPSTPAVVAVPSQPPQAYTVVQHQLQPVADPMAQPGNSGLGRSYSAPPEPMKRSQMLLAMAVIGAGGAATAVLAQKYFIPWGSKFAQKFFSKGDDELRASQEAAEAAANAALEAANATREMVKVHSEEKKQSAALLQAVEAQTSELKTALVTLQTSISASKKDKEAESSITVGELRKELRSFASVLSEFAPTTPATATSDLKSELDDIKGMLLRFSHSPQLVGETVLGSSTKPMPLNLAANQATMVSPGAGVESPSRPKPGTPLQQQPGSSYPSYSEVLEMVQRGEKPPGIRDINDKPPDPSRPLTAPTMAPRPKPWERTPANSSASSFPAPRQPEPITGTPHSSTLQSTTMSPFGTPSSYTQQSFQEAAPWWQNRNPKVGVSQPDSPNQGQTQYNEWGAPVYHTTSPYTAANESDSVQENGETGIPAESNNTKENPSFLPQNARGGSGSFNVSGGGWVPPPMPSTSHPEAVSAIRQRSAVGPEASPGTPLRQNSRAETGTRDSVSKHDGTPQERGGEGSQSGESGAVETVELEAEA